MPLHSELEERVTELSDLASQSSDLSNQLKGLAEAVSNVDDKLTDIIAELERHREGDDDLFDVIANAINELNDLKKEIY